MQVRWHGNGSLNQLSLTRKEMLPARANQEHKYYHTPYGIVKGDNKL